MEKHKIVRVSKHNGLLFYNIDGFGWIMSPKEKSDLINDIKTNKTDFNYNISVFGFNTLIIDEVSKWQTTLF